MKKERFRKGDHVKLKKPFKIEVEYIQIDSVHKGEFHGHIKFWGFNDEITKDDFFRGRNFGGVVYESKKVLQRNQDLIKRLKEKYKDEED